MNMARPGGERVRARLLTRGFTQAYQRFVIAEAANRAEDAFFALFDALNWAHSIDELIATTWSPRGELQGLDWRRDPALGGRERLAHIVRGLRWVRNRVHHQWADALVTDRGLAFPMALPAAFSNWLWRDADDLPEAPEEKEDLKGREAYVTALAGQPVENALTEIGRTFAFVGLLLDPPIPTRRR
jgi:hypothetical protein